MTSPEPKKGPASKMAGMNLYRLFDADDRLLYVGISLHAIQRATEHRRDKPWWPLVARMEFEHLEVESRADAEAIEREVIAVERPVYNVAHHPERRPTRPKIVCRVCDRPVSGTDVVVLRSFELVRTTPRCDMRRCSGHEGPLPSWAEMVSKRAHDPCLAVWRPCYTALWVEAFAVFSKLVEDGKDNEWYGEHAKCEKPRRSREFVIEAEDALRILAGEPPRHRFPLAPFRAMDADEQLPEDPTETHLLPWRPYLE